MSDDINSKFCADYLRECYPGLKASHAHELVAAFFGYKSRAALLADESHPIDYLDVAHVLIPDASALDERRSTLNGLPESLPRSERLVDDLVQCIQDYDLFAGEVWHCFDVGEYVMEEYLPAHVNPELDLELEDVTRAINAIFEDIEYDHCNVEEKESGITVTVRGTYSGYSMDDDSDDEPVIDLEITVYLRRCAGRISFDEPDVHVSGTPRTAGEEAFTAAS